MNGNALEQIPSMTRNEEAFGWVKGTVEREDSFCCLCSMELYSLGHGYTDLEFDESTE